MVKNWVKIYLVFSILREKRKNTLLYFGATENEVDLRLSIRFPGWCMTGIKNDYKTDLIERR